MIKKYKQFLNEDIDYGNDHSLLAFGDLFNIKIDHYMNQEDAIKGKFIGIICPPKIVNPKTNVEYQLKDIMFGEPREKIIIGTPYDRIGKDKDGNIISIAGQVGKDYKFNIKRDTIVDLESYINVVLKRLEGSWVSFMSHWWAYDEEENAPYPEDGVVIKLQQVRHLDDAIVFVDSKGKNYFPDILQPILKRGGPRGWTGEPNENDPYNEEDWYDEANEGIRKMYKNWKKERGRKKFYGNWYNFIKQGEKNVVDIQVAIDKLRNSRDELERMMDELKDNQRKIEEQSFNDLSEEEKEKVLQQRAELEMKMGQMDPYNEEEWGDDDGFKVPSKYRDYIDKLKGIKNYMDRNLDFSTRQKDNLQQQIDFIKDIKTRGPGGYI